MTTKSKFLIRPLITVLFLIPTLGSAQLGDPAATSSRTRTGTSAVLGQPITIFADKTLGAPTLKQGFVHGITYYDSTDYTQTIKLISALKPKSWRLGVDDNTVYGFALIRSNFPRILGTKFATGPQGWF